MLSDIFQSECSLVYSIEIDRTSLADGFKISQWLVPFALVFNRLWYLIMLWRAFISSIHLERFSFKNNSLLKQLWSARKQASKSMHIGALLVAASQRCASLPKLLQRLWLEIIKPQRNECPNDGIWPNSLKDACEAKSKLLSKQLIGMSLNQKSQKHSERSLKMLSCLVRKFWMNLTHCSIGPSPKPVLFFQSI